MRPPVPPPTGLPAGPQTGAAVVGALIFNTPQYYKPKAEPPRQSAAPSSPGVSWQHRLWGDTQTGLWVLAAPPPVPRSLPRAAALRVHALPQITQCPGRLPAFFWAPNYTPAAARVELKPGGRQK